MSSITGELYTKGRVEMITLQSIDWIFKKQIENNVLTKKDVQNYVVLHRLEEYL